MRKKIKFFLKLYALKFSKLKPVRLVNNGKIRYQIHQENVQRYLKRYLYALGGTNSNETAVQNTNVNSNKIWICWLQGLENAPTIVQKCVESIKTNARDYEVILIEKHNLQEYVNFPEHIVEKWESGEISNTHFSDLLRVSLLASYGGIWIDSTVYLTDELPEYITSKNLFVYKESLLNDYGPRKASNWLMACEPGNLIMTGVRDVLFEYWKRENFVLDYYIFHLIWGLVIEHSENYNKEWNAIPYFSNVEPHILHLELFNTFSQSRWEQIKKMSSVHKLSYKFDKDKAKTEQTYYDILFCK